MLQIMSLFEEAAILDKLALDPDATLVDALDLDPSPDGVSLEFVALVVSILLLFSGVDSVLGGTITAFATSSSLDSTLSGHLCSRGVFLDSPDIVSSLRLSQCWQGHEYPASPVPRYIVGLSNCLCCSHPSD